VQHCAPTAELSIAHHRQTLSPGLLTKSSQRLSFTPAIGESSSAPARRFRREKARARADSNCNALVFAESPHRFARWRACVHLSPCAQRCSDRGEWSLLMRRAPICTPGPVKTFFQSLQVLVHCAVPAHALDQARTLDQVPCPRVSAAVHLSGARSLR
jgi:hypothetical protein